MCFCEIVRDTFNVESNVFRIFKYMLIYPLQNIAAAVAFNMPGIIDKPRAKRYYFSIFFAYSECG